MTSDSPCIRFLFQLIRWGWAAPSTLLGLSVGLLGCCCGGSVRRVGPTLEFWGALVTGLLRSRWIRARGMTLGHVILGVTAADLDQVRYHEWVHVRQYERWGPFFLPAYLGASAYLWIVGQHPYLDNPFEREAFTADALRRGNVPSDAES